MKNWGVKEVVEKIDGRVTASGLVHNSTTMKGATDLDLPEKATGDMPMEPNVYTDGSMLTPKG